MAGRPACASIHRRGQDAAARASHECSRARARERRREARAQRRRRRAAARGPPPAPRRRRARTSTASLVASRISRRPAGREATSGQPGRHGLEDLERRGVARADRRLGAVRHDADVRRRQVQRHARRRLEAVDAHVGEPARRAGAGARRPRPCRRRSRSAPRAGARAASTSTSTPFHSSRPPV